MKLGNSSAKGNWAFFFSYVFFGGEKNLYCLTNLP